METDTPQVYFSNLQDCIVRNINNARLSVVAAQCWFTHPEIFSGIILALQRGVCVTLALDYNSINFNSRGLDLHLLTKAGARILVFSGNKLLHHKFAVIDQSTVITGSFNWTRTKLLDHLLVVNDKELARQFTEGFRHIETSCCSFDVMAGRPPKELSFSAMTRPGSTNLHEIRKCVLAGARTWAVSPDSKETWEKWLFNQVHELCFSMPPVRNSHKAKSVSNNRYPRSRNHILHVYLSRIKPGDILIAIDKNQFMVGTGIVPGTSYSDETGFYARRSVLWTECRPVHTNLKPGRLKSFRGSMLELLSKISAQPLDNT
jgi:hypothetical protein